jgi:exopolyphosphatase/guanosine-5'-triphosphate,3'-diphosphate pyrophosphatase
VKPLLEQSEQTRLGEGFYEAHRLRFEAIEETARAVADFARIARGFRPTRIRVIATSAAREALNQDELLRTVQERSGLAVEVLSGQQEASLAFLGVASHPRFADQHLLIVEVGGGSTQFILGHRRQQQLCESYALGTVRLLESMPLSDPPIPVELRRCRRQLNEFLRSTVRPALGPALEGFPKGQVKLIGTGGTMTILAQMELQMNGFDRERIEALRVSSSRIRRQIRRLWSLPLAERKRLVGLPPDRADVILVGVAVVEAVMREFGFETLNISTRGVRFGAILSP